MVPVCSPEPTSGPYTGLPSGFNRYFRIRLTIETGQLTDCLNAQPFSFELADLFHVFPPEQVPALLWFPELGLHHSPKGGWGFFKRHYGIFAPALMIASRRSLRAAKRA